MNRKIVAGGLILAAQIAALPAGAADGIRPGRWEYTVTTRMPNMSQTPAGTGMTATHTSCVTSSDPAAELAKPQGPAAAQSRCNVEKMDRGGSTVSWATTCTTPNGVSRSEGGARYSDERMEANTRTRTTPRNGASLEVSNHIAGHYLGPCDAR